MPLSKIPQISGVNITLETHCIGRKNMLKPAATLPKHSKGVIYPNTNAPVRCTIKAIVFYRLDWKTGNKACRISSRR